MVFFVQCIQNLVTFKRAAVVKTTVPILLYGSIFEWYILERDNQEYICLDKKFNIYTYVTTLIQQFKVPTNAGWGLLTSEYYILDKAHWRQLLAQYV